SGDEVLCDSDLAGGSIFGRLWNGRAVMRMPGTLRLSGWLLLLVAWGAVTARLADAPGRSRPQVARRARRRARSLPPAIEPVARAAGGGRGAGRGPDFAADGLRAPAAELRGQSGAVRPGNTVRRARPRLRPLPDPHRLHARLEFTAERAEDAERRQGNASWRA